MEEDDGETTIQVWHFLPVNETLLESPQRCVDVLDFYFPGGEEIEDALYDNINNLTCDFDFLNLGNDTVDPNDPTI